MFSLFLSENEKMKKLSGLHFFVCLIHQGKNARGGVCSVRFSLVLVYGIARGGKNGGGHTPTHRLFSLSTVLPKKKSTCPNQHTNPLTTPCPPAGTPPAGTRWAGWGSHSRCRSPTRPRSRGAAGTSCPSRPQSERWRTRRSRSGRLGKEGRGRKRCEIRL